MPSARHEAIIDLFRDDPSLASTLLREVLRVPVPAFARIDTTDASLTDLLPVEYRADHVQVLRLATGRPVFGITEEVQLSRDLDKLYTWPSYATATRARFRCETCVLVVAPDAAVAQWARGSIRLGGRNVFHVEVLGPGDLPRPSPEDVRVRPHLAILCTLAHAKTAEDAPLVKAILEAFADVVPRKAVEYHHLVLASLDKACRHAVEQLMKPITAENMLPIFKPAYEKGRVEGLEQGRAASVLSVLETRGLPVTPAQRALVLGCTDVDLLAHWLRRAVTAATTEEALSREQ